MSSQRFKESDIINKHFQKKILNKKTKKVQNRYNITKCKTVNYSYTLFST